MHEPSEPERNEAEMFQDTVFGSDLVTEWVPGDEPRQRAEIVAYHADADDLLARLAAHPDEPWVAYRWETRVAFGVDPVALARECRERFPDGRFCVFPIDDRLKRRRAPVV
jgi:hypothetical protein